MEMSHREIAPDTAVIAIAGKVMMGPESEHITELVNKLAHAGTRIMIFDLSGFTRIDSTGIGRFIASYNEITAGNGEMRIAGAPKLLLQAFHVCRLDTVFRFYPNVEEAFKPV